jgi:kinesin family protein 6/9
MGDGSEFVEDDLTTEAALGGQSSNIDIFLRVKPVPRPTNRIVVDPLDGNVEFNIPRESSAGWVEQCAAAARCLAWNTLLLSDLFPASRLINNSRERYLFNFNGILTPEAKQDEVGCRQQHVHSKA